MGTKIVACIVFLAAAFLFRCSFRSFREKGDLFNNAYLYASKEERERMDKSPHYRQSAICFLFLGFICVTIGLEAILKTGWLFYVEGILFVSVLIYAIVSSVKTSKK